MKPFAFACLLALLLPAGFVHSATEPSREIIRVDRILAIVNSEVVTALEVEEQVRRATRELKRQGTPIPQRDLLEKQLLERLITTRVLLQYAKDTGLRVDDAQIDKAVARIAQDNKLSPEEFRGVIAEEGLDFGQYREDIRSEILMARLREREVESRITVSDAEIDGFFKLQQASGQNEEYSLLHILVTVPEGASAEQIGKRRGRADEALGKLKAGADFKQISATYSDAPNAIQGGELGWRPVGRLPTIFAQAIATMNPGDVSPVLRSPNGFHILKLVEKRSTSKEVIVQQMRVRHILVRLNEIVSEAEARRRLADIRARILAGGDFAEFARAQSEDASAARGGDLGWLSPGETVPEFERAADALAPGEISEPVQTPFGWHLIQVQERRTENMTKEREKQLARQAIRARKADEAFTDWVRQQRDQAFVEYRTDDR